MHFLQESYKFVQESQILQSFYNVEHVLQDSDNIFAKNAFFGEKFLQKNVMCYFDQNFKNHQTPATTATDAVYNAQTVPGSQQKGPNC